MNVVFICTVVGTSFGLILNETGVVPPRTMVYSHMTALFGIQTEDPMYETSGPLIAFDPVDGCLHAENVDELEDAIVLVKWGSCDDIHKALNVDYFGGIGMVVGNDEGDTLYPMSCVEPEDISFPCVFVGESTFNAALYALSENPTGTVFATISDEGNVPDPNLLATPNLMQIIVYLLITFPTVWTLLTIRYFCLRNRVNGRHQRQHHIRNNDIPEVMFAKDLLDPSSNETGELQMRRRETRLINNSCPICLDFFDEKVKIKLLPCGHGFHLKCLGPWIAHSDSCPICRQTILDKNEVQSRYCCRYSLWPFPSETEIRQHLIVSDAEERRLDMEVPVDEYLGVNERTPPRQEEDNVLIRNSISISQGVQEHVQTDDKPSRALRNRNFLAVNQFDLRRVTIKESKHFGVNSPNNDQ